MLGIKEMEIGYTIREAAQIKGLCTRTVQRQIWNNEIRAILKGKMYIIPPSELDKIKVRPAHCPKKSITRL